MQFVKMGVSLVFFGAAFVAIDSWYRSQPEVAFELKFVPSKPEQFKCMLAVGGVRSQGDWFVQVKNLSPTPILIDSLQIVTWHRSGGVVLEIEERNEVVRTSAGLEPIKLANFRLDGEGIQTRVQSDWFPEISPRSVAFIREDGCSKPISWQSFQQKTNANLDGTMGMTVTISFTYRQGKTKSISAVYDPAYQAWITKPEKLISVFGFGA